MIFEDVCSPRKRRVHWDAGRHGGVARWLRVRAAGVPVVDLVTLLGHPAHEASMSDQEQALSEVTVDSPSQIDVVLLRTGDAVAALPAASVEYVAELTKLTPIPHAPAVVAGLTALRGEVVAVFFLRPLLGLERAAVPEHARIVVVAHEDDRVVLAVDAVTGPVVLALDELEPAKIEGALVRGVDPSGVSLLDPDALLADERLFVDTPLPQVEHSMTARARATP